MIQETWQRFRIADIIGGEIRTDNLATDKVKAEVQLALGFMILLKPFALAEYLQSGAINYQMGRGLAVGPLSRLQN